MPLWTGYVVLSTSANPVYPKKGENGKMYEPMSSFYFRLLVTNLGAYQSMSINAVPNLRKLDGDAL